MLLERLLLQRQSHKIDRCDYHNYSPECDQTVERCIIYDQLQ
jgi:hypothetical protein